MPNYFENIIGQESVCNVLQKQIDNNCISHANLFIGPSSCGKFDCAIALAKALEGDNFAEKISNNAFPDVKIYEPKGINAYLVAQIKEIVSDSNLAPIQGKYKIYIIKNAEKLNVSSANAFLKTLEEPAPNVCFILLANNLNNVLPTIVSRCQIFNFKSLPFDLAFDKVQKKSGAAVEDAKNALELFGGDISAAVEFCLDQNMIDLHSEIIHTVETIDSLSDWETLQRSQDIANKIKEISDVYKAQLEEKTKDMSDVLSSSAISDIEDQNKRMVSSKQKDLLKLFMSSIKLYLRNKIDEKKDNQRLIYTLNVLSEIEHNLSYNIAMQNFLDVVLLKVKYKGNWNYD